MGNATEVSSKTPRLGLKVRRFIVCDDAIDGRIPIGSERKKSNLDDEQPIFIPQTSDDLFVLEIRFFKHGHVNCITLRRFDHPWSLDQGVD